MTKQQPLIIRPNIKDEYFFDEGCYILEMSNSEADPELSIAQARVLPGTKTQLHKLNKTIERYIILQGSGKVTLGDMSPIKVTKGDIVIIPENQPQAIENISGDDLIFLVICSPRFDTKNYKDCH